ncbi:MAG: hypothetical protein RR500_07680 [Bacilli bacterium]
MALFIYSTLSEFITTDVDFPTFIYIKNCGIFESLIAYIFIGWIFSTFCGAFTAVVGEGVIGIILILSPIKKEDIYKDLEDDIFYKIFSFGMIFGWVVGTIITILCVFGLAL